MCLCQLLLGAGRWQWWERRSEGGPTRCPHPSPHPYLGAVEITQVRVSIPAWAAGTLIDVHTLNVYVHPYLPPRAVNQQLGTQRRMSRWTCVLGPQTTDNASSADISTAAAVCRERAHGHSISPVLLSPTVCRQQSLSPQVVPRPPVPQLFDILAFPGVYKLVEEGDMSRHVGVGL